MPNLSFEVRALLSQYGPGLLLAPEHHEEFCQLAYDLYEWATQDPDLKTLILSEDHALEWLREAIWDKFPEKPIHWHIWRDFLKEALGRLPFRQWSQRIEKGNLPASDVWVDQVLEGHLSVEDIVAEHSKVQDILDGSPELRLFHWLLKGTYPPAWVWIGMDFPLSAKTVRYVEQVIQQGGIPPVWAGEVLLNSMSLRHQIPNGLDVAVQYLLQLLSKDGDPLLDSVEASLLLEPKGLEPITALPKLALLIQRHPELEYLLKHRFNKLFAAASIGCLPLLRVKPSLLSHLTASEYHVLRGAVWLMPTIKQIPSSNAEGLARQAALYAAVATPEAEKLLRECLDLLDQQGKLATRVDDIPLMQCVADREALELSELLEMVWPKNVDRKISWKELRALLESRRIQAWLRLDIEVLLEKLEKLQTMLEGYNDAWMKVFQELIYNCHILLYFPGFNRVLSLLSTEQLLMLMVNEKFQTEKFQVFFQGNNLKKTLPESIELPWFDILPAHDLVWLMPKLVDYIINDFETSEIAWESIERAILFQTNKDLRHAAEKYGLPLPPPLPLGYPSHPALLRHLRPWLEQIGNPSPEETANKLKDACNEMWLPKIAGAALAQMMVEKVIRRGFGYGPGLWLHSAFDAWKDHPAALARVLYRQLKQEDKPPLIWLRGLVFALVKLREPLGGKVPLLLEKLASESPTDLAELLHTQKDAFDQKVSGQQRKKAPEIRMAQALLSLQETWRQQQRRLESQASP